MLCDNCGENEATIRLTQIINGKKTEMMICEECSEKFGITNMNFEIPIDISDFLGDLSIDAGMQNFMPLDLANNLKCNKCNMTYQEFLDSGKFGCEECYKTFENKIDILLKRIQGTDRYIGKKAEHNESNSVQETKTDNKLEK